MRRLGGVRIGWGLVLGMSALWSGCGGGLGPGAGGTGAGGGPLGAAGSGAASSGGAEGNGVAGQGIAGLNPGGAETSGGTTSSGGLGACPAGTESCPCYGNDTCNSGLTCVSRVCVNLAGTGGASTGGAATSGSATGGVATGGAATGGSATGGTNTGGTATGGVASGGRATGGVTTGGAVSVGGGSTGPGCDVDGPCAGQSCPSCTVFTITTYVSGELGSGASCYETTAAISGGLCGNFVVPRTLTINGTDMNCTGGGNWPTLPAKVNGGYCLVISAGDYQWAYFDTW